MTCLKCCFVDNSVSPTFSWKEDSKVLKSRLLGRFLFPLMRLLAILSFERYGYYFGENDRKYTTKIKNADLLVMIPL